MGTGNDRAGGQGRHGSAEWRVSTDGETAVVTLSGDLDLAAIDGPTHGILGALRDAIARELLVVCDLSEIRFIDSSGYELLIRLKRDVENRNGRFVLARPTSEVRRMMHLMGLEGEFEVTD